MDLLINNLPQYGHALLTTLSLMFLGLAWGFFMAVPIALIAIEAPRPFKLLALIHTTFFRGTPLLVQVFMIYYGLGQVSVVRNTFLWIAFKEPFFCAVLALALNTSAYTASIIKGAILSVPKGEIEAGAAFGLHRSNLYRYIIFPYALRLFLPAYGSEIITIMKATSLAATITLLDLTSLAKLIMSRTFRPFESFIITASIYIAITFVLTRIIKLVEKLISQEGKIDRLNRAHEAQF
jgi:polar amino acid transport system permease protein/octopine/nopaline transport system permease protein